MKVRANTKIQYKKKKNNVENYPGKAIFVSLRASSLGATVPPEAPGDFLAG